MKGGKMSKKWNTITFAGMLFMAVLAMYTILHFYD
jgi:hypothetical protein